MCFKRVQNIKKSPVGLYSEVEKTSIPAQPAEQEVKKMPVKQEHYLQESALHRQLKTSTIFINVIFRATKFNFVVIKFSKINGSLHYFCYVRDCYSKYT